MGEYADMAVDDALNGGWDDEDEGGWIGSFWRRRWRRRRLTNQEIFERFSDDFDAEIEDEIDAEEND